MSKLISFALVIVILAPIAIADPNQPETIEQQVSNLVPAADSQLSEPDQLELNSLDIIELEKHIQQVKEEIDKKFDYQMRCNDIAMNSVNTSISGATHALAIFAIIVTFGGIILGVYISVQVKNVTNIAKQCKSVLEIRDEVMALDENIKNNMSKLYSSLKEEETIALVERLCEVPEDVNNLFQILASRPLSAELFPQMKKAFQSLSGDLPGHEGKDQYYILFFQHFAGLAIIDEDLQGEIENRLLELIQSCFRNDIIKASEDFIKVVAKDILGFSGKIKKYFIALQQSHFAEFTKLHDCIYNTLLTKENRFNLYFILQSDAMLKGLAIIYGQHLLSNYKDVKNTEAESEVLTEIAGAIETKEEDMEASQECLCCKNKIPKERPRKCPICGHEFQGQGWDGIDAHWRANHEDYMPYEKFWASLCREHKS